MTEAVRLRNAGHADVRFLDAGVERCVTPGGIVEVDPRTAAVLRRMSPMEPVKAAPEAPASPIIIPAGARTAGTGR
jgi:hypothetical protein